LNAKVEEFVTMPNTVRVTLEVPPEFGDHAGEIAQTRAHEAAVLALWQEGKLTIREAALELGLSYHGFLDLLAARGIPVVHGGEINVKAIEEASRKLASGHK
jgi:predicted HTH domain antitoxin